tara:strand:+ start:498 stop:1265 length:768 start_codon:yes stop_codon:yes gene_type:complete
MKVGILAGGFGTRLSEETVTKPKPMVEIGEKPILWHIMKSYSSFGYNEFIIGLGYKGELIKEYFVNYNRLSHSLTVDLGEGKVQPIYGHVEPWKVHLLDTGLHTMTGGRIKQISKFVGEEPFMLTYGDGVCDINIKELIEFHKSHGKLATVTAVRPPARFGGLTLAGDRVIEFQEKSQIREGWINGGFFILEPEVCNYIGDMSSVFELEPLEKLAAEGQLMAYKHHGFWHCMDTVRDVKNLNYYWTQNKAPWKNW